jgi:hypothetical protein
MNNCKSYGFIKWEFYCNILCQLCVMTVCVLELWIDCECVVVRAGMESMGVAMRNFYCCD